jgi:type VI secretion system protein ImpA
VRAFRWGEIRACADDIDPRLLEAPTTAQRTQLKTLLLEQRWAELLEAAETAMAMPCGRGWLDLQRYTVTACENLGAEYAVLASAIRAVTQIYLRDAPRLLGMTLLDDISVANAETRAWLGRMYTATERTMAAHTETGTAPETLAELNAALARASSARSRFLLRTQMARLLVEGGREAIALPMLEQLAQEIDEHKLEEWEDGAVTAEPLVLLYRAMAKSGGDPAVLQGLYLRICKLDPLQAIDGLGQ